MIVIRKDLEVYVSTINNDGAIIDFVDNNTCLLFKFKQIIAGQTGNDGTKNVEIIVLLKYLSNI